MGSTPDPPENQRHPPAPPLLAMDWQNANRLLRLLSSCSQAMIRSLDQPTLLQDICRLLIEVGGYVAAWGRFTDVDASPLHPAAHAGAIDDLTLLHPRGLENDQTENPVTLAIGAGEVAIAQDIPNNPTYAQWREAAVQGGYAALIALPVRADTHVLGEVWIYAADPNAFGADEVQVLSEVATNLGYTVLALRQQMERAATASSLHESEAKFRTLLEMASEAVIISNQQGEIVVFNTKAEQLFGYRSHEILGQPLEVLMPERFRHGHRQFRTEYMQRPSQRSMGSARNLFALRKDGSEFPMEAGLSSVQIGDELFVLTFLSDISDRQRLEDERRIVEDKLRESEKRFRDMADHAPVMIRVTDPAGHCTYLSRSWYDLTGQAEGAGLGLGWINAVHPDDRDMAERTFLFAHSHKEIFRMEYRLQHHDGGYRWIIDTATPWFGEEGQFKGYIGSVIDISDRKQAEQALQESEARLKLASKATRSGLWDWNLSTNSAHISEEYCILFGLSPNPQTLSYEQWLSHLHPDDRASASEAVNRVIQQRQDYYEDEYRVLRPDGVCWLAARGQVFYDAANHPVRMLGYMQDITERKEVELALSQLNEELEHRVRDRTAELSQLTERLQQELEKRERIQQRLAEQAQLLDLAHDPIITRTLKGEITFWNQGAERVYGWTQTEALGQLSHRLLQTQLPYPLSDISTELLANRYWEGELVHRRRDGRRLTMASRWVLQCNDQGVPMKVLEINNDITSSKRAEEVQARLAAIIESSDDAIISTTLDGTINSWNWGAEKLYGYSASDVLGQSTTLLLPADRQHEEMDILTRIQRGDRIEHYETIRRHKDGRLIDISLTASPLKNAAGTIIGISKIARDITRRKQTEAQLQLSNERISLANAELARASRLKDEFLAGMSHELRTPLNAILGLSEALLEEIFGDLTEEQREHLGTIQRSGQHLLELINDILDLSKIESGKMELEIRPVLVRELCESSLNFIKQQAHHKRIKIECRIDEELIEAQLDERRIRQVLVNLLSNAVKFTPDGGRVGLHVRADSFRETVEFSITDTGIGISPDNISKLFQPFVQLDSALSRRYAGTGLGLVLVRRIAELHGGSVALESHEGKGSRFTVTLPWCPLTLEAEPSPQTPESASHLLPIRKALIIEDSQAAASQLARYLNEMGAKPLVHTTGGGAVQVTTQANPDVIILDILLPDRSGWDVLAELKANPSTRSIPVVVVSVVDDRPNALALGATAYLLKPFTRPQFQQTLNRVCSRVTDGQTIPFLTETQPSTHSPLILLAEDNEANITTLNSYLQAHGFQVQLARNGVEAIQMAQHHNPNLILMDIQMPEMDGLEAIQRIHADPDLQHIPIIALTALAMPGDRDRCLSAGAVDYLTKPVSLKQLLTLLAHYIPQVDLS